MNIPQPSVSTSMGQATTSDGLADPAIPLAGMASSGTAGTVSGVSVLNTLAPGSASFALPSCLPEETLPAAEEDDGFSGIGAWIETLPPSARLWARLEELGDRVQEGINAIKHIREKFLIPNPGISRNDIMAEAVAAGAAVRQEVEAALAFCTAHEGDEPIKRAIRTSLGGFLNREPLMRLTDRPVNTQYALGTLDKKQEFLALFLQELKTFPPPPEKPARTPLTLEQMQAWVRALAGNLPLLQRFSSEQARQFAREGKRGCYNYPVVWQMLEYPEHFPAYPKLAELKSEMLQVLAADPKLFSDPEQLWQELSLAVRARGIPPQTTGILSRYTPQVIAYLSLHCQAADPDRKRGPGMRIRNNDLFLQRLRAQTYPFLEQIQAWGRHGQPMHGVEVAAFFLERAGIRLTESNRNLVFEEIPGIQRTGNYYYPIGQEPSEIYLFRHEGNQKLGTVYWRGRDPLALDRAGEEQLLLQGLRTSFPEGSSADQGVDWLATAMPQKPRSEVQETLHRWIDTGMLYLGDHGRWLVSALADANPLDFPGVLPAIGLCRALLEGYPGGCGNKELLDLVNRILPDTPDEDGKARGPTLLRQYKRRGLLISVAPGMWAPAPQYLCQGAAQRILAHCPRAEEAAVRPGASNSSSAAMSVSDGPPAQKRGRTKVRAPQSLTVQATQADRIDRLLKDLAEKNELAAYIHTSDGKEVFDKDPLLKRIVAELPGLTPKMAAIVLANITPESFALGDRAAKRPRLTQGLPEMLRYLFEHYPYFIFLSRNETAALVNSLQSDAYLDLCTFEMYLNTNDRLSPWEDIKQEIDKLDAAGRLESMIAPGTTGTGLNSTHLQTYLACKGLRINPAMLKAKLHEHHYGSFLETKTPLPRYSLERPNQQCRAARVLMQVMRLQKGDALPAWNDFIQAFESAFCEAGTRYYSGRVALNVYRVLEKQLENGLITIPPSLSCTRGEAAQDKKTASAARKKIVPPPEPPVSPASSPLPSSRPPGQPVVAHGGTLGQYHPDWNNLQARVNVACFEHQVARSCLGHAINNMLFSAGYFQLDPAFQVHGSECQTLHTRMTGPDGREEDGFRLPDGTRLLELKMTAADYAIAGDLLARHLDMALIYRGDAAITYDELLQGAGNHGHYVAFRRTPDGPVYLDSRRAGPDFIGGGTTGIRRCLGTDDGQLWIHIPPFVCRGPVSQLQSYYHISGFMAAFDAIRAILPGPPPLAHFLNWLDTYIGLPGGLASHEDLNRVRRSRYPTITSERAADFIAGCQGQPWQAVPVSELTLADGGQGFIDDLTRQLRHRPPGTWGLLKLPLDPPLMAVALGPDGRPKARIYGQYRDCGELVNEAVKSWWAAWQAALTNPTLSMQQLDQQLDELRQRGKVTLVLPTSR